MPSIDQLLAASGLHAAEARLLLAHVLRADRAWVIAHGDAGVPEEQAARISALFARRRAGEPMAYLTGEREFRGLSMIVDRNVLIPRPETECVVDEVLDIVSGAAAPRILDLGTGSGAIAVAIAHARPDAEVWASDASVAALSVAAANAARHRVSVRFVQGNWLEALGEERFDVIASNPPYIAEHDPHLTEGDVRFEPRAALIGGVDGLDCVRHIATVARMHLRRAGWLVLEHGYDQGPACVRMFAGLGYVNVRDTTDLAGLPRVCRGQFDAPQEQG